MENKILKQLIDEAQACGHQDTRIRDVGFAILNSVLRSPKATYAMMFPGQDEQQYKQYSDSPLQKTLAKRVNILLKERYTPADTPAPSTDTPAANPDEITDEQNRLAMMAMLKEIEDEKTKDQADIPKLLKIEADIRTKLRDKFEVTQTAERQLIIVQPKFNHICEKTGKECWLQTKEYAMEHWGLIDPKKSK